MQTPRRCCRRQVCQTAVSVACGALLLLTPTHPSVAQEASGDPIRRVRQPIKGQYIVRLHETADADAVGIETTALYRGRLRHVFRHAVQGFAAQMSDAAARTLARDPRVTLIEEDGLVTPTAVQIDPPSWGLDRIDQRALPLDAQYAYATPAAAVNVYVIDSGIRITHAEFEGRAFIAADFVDDDGDGDPDDIANDDGEPATPDGADCLGHGTLMAGTIAGGTVGVAKNALVWAVRVFGCDGAGTWSAVIAAVDMLTAEARRPAVVNMSLAGSPSAVADAAIQRSIAAGITYVTAAGNGDEDAATLSPSRLLEPLVAGSTGLDDRRSLFSNWGPTVDLFAPGEAIVTAAVESDTDLATMAGTSAAAAHVTGVAAMYLGANPSATPAIVHTALVTAATTGLVMDPGSGSPNRLLYSAFLLTTPKLTVTSPNDRVNWGRGSRQLIRWTHNLPEDSMVRVLVSRDGGKTFATVADRVKSASPTTGRLPWVVSGPNTEHALVRVESSDALAFDESDSTFVVADPYIRVSTPNGGETWTTGRRVRVRWDDNLGPTDDVTISLSKNGGNTYHWMLIPRTPADGVQSVTVRPPWSTRRARVRISWVSRRGVGDISDETFTILRR
jgi:hypothetical protein